MKPDVKKKPVPAQSGPRKPSGGQKVPKGAKRETRQIKILPGGFVRWRELAKLAGCSLGNVVEWLALAPEAGPTRKAVVASAARFCRRQPGEVEPSARQHARGIVRPAEGSAII